MAFSVQMPALGESVTEGTVTRWLKQEGERVEVDEPLLEVSTDKVDTEIPSPAAGVLQRIVVGEDETVQVGAELAVIGDGPDGGAGSSDDAAASTAAESPGDADGESGELDNSTSSTAPTTEPAEQSAPEAPSTEETQSADAPSEQPPPQPAPRPSPAPSPQPKAAEEQAGPAAAPTATAEPTGGAGQTAITMPALGESVTEGTVTRWLKQVGDYVAIDEPLLEVSTDKVDTEIPSPVAGVLQEISAGEDQTVEVGGRLALISATTGSPAGSAPEAAPDASEATTAQTADDAGAPPAETTAGDMAPGDMAPGDLATGATAATDGADQTEADDTNTDDVDAGDAGAGADQPSREAERAELDELPDHQPDRPGAAASELDGDGSGPYVTPLVRKLAAGHNVDLDTVSGTGVGGRIRKQDVLAAAERTAAERTATERAAAEPAPERGQPAPMAQPPAAAAQASPEATALRGTTEKLSRLRAVIAARMVESLQQSAQLTAVVEVDVTRVARLRQAARKEFEAREGVKLTFLPFFAKAAIEALKLHPKLNASIDVERGVVTYHGAEHLAIAVDTERGLIVPVIHDAGDLSIAGLARKIADIAERTRTNKVKPDELAGGTFTLTNIGSRGSLLDTPIINQPQVGILGTGAVVKRPVVVSEPDGDTIAIRSMAYLVLTYDHRLVDGADASRFLTTIKQRIEQGGFADDLAV